MDVHSLQYDGKEWSDPFPDVDSHRTLVLAFGARTYLDAPEPLEQLAEAYPRASIAGCSTAGEIHGTAISDDTLSVAIATFDAGRVATASSKIEAMENSKSTGQELAEQVSSDDLTAVLVLSKGLDVNGTRIAEGLNERLDDSVVVTGGLAGDGDRFERTWVLGDDGPHPDVVAAVALYGDNFVVSHGSKGGWEEFGPERDVTKSEGNIVHELDETPALELYRRYLGRDADDLPASALFYPLKVDPPDEAERPVLRTILGIDADAQTMTFAGDIPEGSRAQLMKVDFDRLVEGASEAARESTSMSDHSLRGGDVLGLAISCVGRRLVLKQRSTDELEAAHDVLPTGTHLHGFYSYGELSPHIHGEPCALHNQTMTLTVLSER